MAKTRLIKRYANRRLYDTGASSYITLPDLAAIIKKGHDVKVIDAKGGDDLTQAILAQIVMESGAARLLPPQLLTQLIRMDDDALAEFMQLYVAWAFDIYSQAKRGFGRIPGLNAFGGNPLNQFLGMTPWGRAAQHNRVSPPEDVQHAPMSPPTVTPTEAQPSASANDVLALRAELDELKDMLRGMKKP